MKDTYSAQLCVLSQVGSVSVSDQFDSGVIETIYLTEPSIVTRRFARCATSHITLNWLSTIS